MITHTHPANVSRVPWFLPENALPDTSIFIDIETTGFRASSSHLYMIGVLYYTGSGWKTIQWMSEKPSEEAALLRVFSAFIRPYRTLIHFNGERFDLPYLREKYDQYQIDDPLSVFTSIDLYRTVRILKPLLALDHMNQKSLECFLGISREDRFDGGALIRVYHSFCREPSPPLLKQLMDHNREDLTGMLRLLSLMAYLPLAGLCVSPDETGGNQYGDSDKTKIDWCISGNDHSTISGSEMLHIFVRLPNPVPVRIFRDAGIFSIQVSGSTAELMVPIYSGKLKYFFDNPRDYYYLPLEDQAIHKSVAVYVDPQHRVKATKETCYISKEGRFLPQLPDGGFTPVYRRVWNDSVLFFELPQALDGHSPDESDSSELFLRQYASMLLSECFRK